MIQEIELVLSIYDGLISTKTTEGIPVALRPLDVIGTVQDDPFDSWIDGRLKELLPENYEVYHCGKLTTPDIIIRDKNTNLIVGLEIKKLIQKPNFKDSRGLTLDYNSSLPCGRAMVKVGKDTLIVPCYYLFALLNPYCREIVTLIIMDGDFLNYDFELYKEAKFSNYTEYNHGPYGEGSIRHRKMYTYPNPLDSGLSIFSFRQLLVVKSSNIAGTALEHDVSEEIERTDKFGNTFYYSLIDRVGGKRIKQSSHDLVVLKDIFNACKTRKPKNRVAYVPEIPKC